MMSYVCHMMSYVCHVMSYVCHVMSYVCHVMSYVCHVSLVLSVLQRPVFEGLAQEALSESVYSLHYAAGAIQAVKV